MKSKIDGTDLKCKLDQKKVDEVSAANHAVMLLQDLQGKP